MEMFLLHDTRENDQEREISFPPTFLEKNLDNHVFFRAPKFVEIPNGLYSFTCYNFHGYPSQELTVNEAKNFLHLLANCPCHCARIEYPREYMLGSYDHLHQHFNELQRKFNSFEDLTAEIRSFDEKSWKLMRESDTKKDKMVAGPVIDMLMELPEGILEDYKTSFHEFLKKLYKERIGFVKGRYLVISTEVLFRQCLGNTVLFLDILSEAYALVESQYCSISRFAIESGFWQVCPEFGGFFWRNNNLEKDFPFLRKFMQEKRNVFVKNFSLSMGPYYLIGGGYFSYIENIGEDLIFWYVPNFWQEAFAHEENACFYNAENFWYGWDGRKKLKYGCPYNGVTVNECDYKMLEFFPTAIVNYYEERFHVNYYSY